MLNIIKKKKDDLYINDTIHEYLVGADGRIDLDKAPLGDYDNKSHQRFWKNK